MPESEPGSAPAPPGGMHGEIFETAVQEPSPWATENLQAHWQARFANEKGHRGLTPGEQGALGFAGSREG